MAAKPPASSKAAPKGGAAPAKKKNRGVVGFIIAMMCAIGAVVMLPTTIIFVVGMVPSAVAYFVDNSRDRTLGPTILFLNFAGVVPVLVQLWQSGHNMENALNLLMQPNLLLIMLLPAGFGWVLFMYVPTLVGGLLRRRAEARIRNLEKEQEILIELWGHSVAGGMGPADKKEAAPEHVESLA